MIKDFLLARAGPDTPPEELRRHIMKHAVLAISTPALAREMQRFTINHVCDDSADRLCVHPRSPGLVTVVEHMMGGWDGIARFSTDAQYLSVVRPDEQYMAETLMDGAPQFVAVLEERPIFTSEAPIAYRILDFVRRPESMSRARFLDALADDGARAEQDGAYRIAVARRVHSFVGPGAASYGTDAAPLDAVIETWISAPDRMAERMDELRRRRAPFCDPDRSFTAVTQEHWIHGDSDAFGDRTTASGSPSTAGLRGC